MTKKHLMKKYQSLLKKVETDKFYTIADLTKTKDIDSGVTPFTHTSSTCGESVEEVLKLHTIDFDNRKTVNERIIAGGLLHKKVEQSGGENGQ